MSSTCLWKSCRNSRNRSWHRYRTYQNQGTFALPGNRGTVKAEWGQQANPRSTQRPTVVEGISPQGLLQLEAAQLQLTKPEQDKEHPSPVLLQWRLFSEMVV